MHRTTPQFWSHLSDCLKQFRGPRGETSSCSRIARDTRRFTSRKLTSTGPFGSGVPTEPLPLKKGKICSGFGLVATMSTCGLSVSRG